MSINDEARSVFHLPADLAKHAEQQLSVCARQIKAVHSAHLLFCGGSPVGVRVAGCEQVFYEHATNTLQLLTVNVFAQDPHSSQSILAEMTIFGFSPARPSRRLPVKKLLRYTGRAWMSSALLMKFSS